MATRAQLLGQRLLLAADLFETGVILRRQYLHRKFPTLTPRELDDRIREWLGARHADGAGREVAWPRR